MREPHPILNERPFTDQTRRYHQLQDERAANWWKIALLLVLFDLGAVLTLAFTHGPWYKILLLRVVITILTTDVLAGCCLLVADQSLRHHENSGTNLDWKAAEEKGRPDWTASFHQRTLRRSQMLYYLGTCLGVLLFVLVLWLLDDPKNRVSARRKSPRLGRSLEKYRCRTVLGSRGIPRYR